jgi:pSer/pThr/pTyr-binding forkhead associated (FHA) protein
MVDDVPILIAQSGPLNGQRWNIETSITIGRDEQCEIVINDRQVSRQHARIKRTPQGVALEDLGSKNGTHYNSNPFEDKILLKDGDTVQIALVQQFLFLSSDATLPLDADVTDLQPLGNYKLRLEKRSRRVLIRDQEVSPPLSVSQFKLLEMLYDQPGKVVPRAELIKAVWGEAQAVMISEQALDALVRRLRERLRAVDPDHAYVITVRGHGLRLDNPSQ